MYIDFVRGVPWARAWPDQPLASHYYFHRDFRSLVSLANHLSSLGLSDVKSPQGYAAKISDAALISSFRASSQQIDEIQHLFRFFSIDCRNRSSTIDRK